MIKIEDACDDPVWIKIAHEMAEYMAKNIPWERHDECLVAISNTSGQILNIIKGCPVSCIMKAELKETLKNEERKCRHRVKIKSEE